MLIPLYSGDSKLPPVHAPVTMLRVVIGVVEAWGAMIALTDDWKWKEMRVITFESFSWRKKWKVGGGGSIELAAGSRMRLSQRKKEHELLKWNLFLEAGEESKGWWRRGTACCCNTFLWCVSLRKRLLVSFWKYSELSRSLCALTVSSRLHCGHKSAGWS